MFLQNLYLLTQLMPFSLTPTDWNVKDAMAEIIEEEPGNKYYLEHLCTVGFPKFSRFTNQNMKLNSSSIPGLIYEYYENVV